MNSETASHLFESLSSTIRLDVFRLLIKQGAEGMVAGEIGTALAIAPTNLSFHLKALAHAGLIQATQEGRFQRYRANMVLMLDLIAYMTEECCHNQPQQCLEACAPAVPLSANTSST